MSEILVVDVGTSSVRALVVHDDATVSHEHRQKLLPDSPAPGLVEFDATELGRVAIDLATSVLDEHGSVAAVGITNQRASTVVWDRASGEPVAPGQGWQDLRTVGRCLELKGSNHAFAPNQSALKAEAILDAADPDRTRDLCVGTVDTWIAWQLSGGSCFVTDATNASVTGLVHGDCSGWDDAVLNRLRIPASALAEIVDTSGVVGTASALPGAPPIAALCGDQQASLAGQGGMHRGDAKITFGTGGMLDVVVGDRPRFPTRGAGGTFPLVARRIGGIDTWALEAIILAAGTNVEWLRDDLGLIASSPESHDVASRCDNTGDVWFVPALLGLGTPEWDYGARGALVGLTRGTGAPEVVRAVLEGVAHRGADLVDAAETDAGFMIERIRVDGGMTQNPTFVQALADATQRAVEVAPVTEATALGAGFLAGLAVGTWTDEDAIAATWRPALTYEPKRVTDRERWRAAVERAKRWIPDLSAIDF